MNQDPVSEHRAYEEVLAVLRRLSHTKPQQERLAHTVAVALLGYLLDLGDAVGLLIAHGDAEPCLPILRTMASTAINILAIWQDDGDADGVALQYLRFSAHLRKRRLSLPNESRGIGPALADRLDSEESAAESRLLADLVKTRGVKPVAFGNDARTWSGLSDRDLAKWVRKEAWYQDYFELSNALHANVSAIWRRLVDPTTAAQGNRFSAHDVLDRAIELSESAAYRVLDGAVAGAGDKVTLAVRSYWLQTKPGAYESDLLLKYPPPPSYWDEHDSE